MKMLQSTYGCKPCCTWEPRFSYRGRPADALPPSVMFGSVRILVYTIHRTFIPWMIHDHSLSEANPFPRPRGTEPVRDFFRSRCVPATTWSVNGEWGNDMESTGNRYDKQLLQLLTFHIYMIRRLVHTPYIYIYIYVYIHNLPVEIEAWSRLRGRGGGGILYWSIGQWQHSLHHHRSCSGDTHHSPAKYPLRI